MLRIEMLPARHGDALLVEYGPDEEVTHRTLIDAGPAAAYRDIRERLAAIPAGSDGRRQLELLVVTHVDGDHIEGVVKLVQDDELGAHPGDVWFNDWGQLESVEHGRPPAKLGPEAGEFLGALLVEMGLPWNQAFGGAAVVVPDEEAATLQTWQTPGGLRLTVVSPTVDRLLALRKTWRKAITAAGFTPGDREAALRDFARRRWARAPTGPVQLGDEGRRSSLDHSEANGSSIALVAEYGGRTVLLAGDAYAPELRLGLERWQQERGATGDEPVQLDAFKLPHHGSDKNITPQLVRAMRCDRYLVSTNGAIFRHPDQQALRTLLAGHEGSAPPELLFNYRSRFTEPWADRDDCVSRYGTDAVLELATDGAPPRADRHRFGRPR
jgi:hypothetical protein